MGKKLGYVNKNPWSADGKDSRENAFRIGVDIANAMRNGNKVDICSYIHQLQGGAASVFQIDSSITTCDAVYKGENTNIKNHKRSIEIDDGGNIK